jgi:hypothetical protein
MAWMAGLSLAGFLVILLVVIFLKHGDPPAPPVANVAPTPDTATGNIAEKQARTPAALMAEAQPVVEKFLNARTVAELLEVVDQPDVVAGRLARIAPDGALDAPGFGEMGDFSQWFREGAHVTLPVRTKDFEFRLLTLRDGPDGVKVDWESSVGWSDIPWERFGEDEASAAGVFRAVIKPVEYYNFDFSDEQKWQSYQLESPDGLHSMYGYVERGSAMQLNLQACLADQAEARVMLELRYPEGARGRDQARIIRKIAEDWIDPERKAQP